MKCLLASLILFLLGSLTVSAQTADKQVDAFISTHKQKRAQNPEGLSFTVRLKDNQKQFHLGEIIPLELSFAASKPETFKLDAATYDRSGRLHSDEFVLDPREGVVDPLADYFDAQIYPFMAGGLRSIPDLTDKPHVITAELNEWQRIDKPGHYRLYVISSRLRRKESGSSHVVSDVIEFDVLPPDKKWAGQKLNEAISALSKSEESRYSACRTLRFLGTTAAVAEMRKRFGGDDNKCEWEYKFGLIGSPHRDFVIRDMESAISFRKQSVTQHYITTLALLEFTKRAPEIPPAPPAENEDQIKQWRSVFERRRELFDELCLNYVRQLVMVIPLKQGHARAVSLQTLLNYQTELNSSASLALLPEVFSQLSLNNQLELLTYRWKPIASAAMLPVLREVFKYSYNNTPLSAQTETFHKFKQEELRSIALRRLYELSPEEGRRLLLEEIRRPTQRVSADVLGMLPDKTLPELNTVLLGNFEAALRDGNSEWIAELIERYATDEIFLQLRSIYEARKPRDWGCRTPNALMGYFLRVEPSLGAEYLKKIFSARGKDLPRCYESTLNHVAKLHMSAEVEEVAIAVLDDEEPEVASQGAIVLANYGSADAEKALWRRFEKWHDAMQDRSEGRAEEPSQEEQTIETALREALTRGQGWLSDPEKSKRVRDLCWSEACRSEVDRLIVYWDPQISINTTYFDEIPRFAVANREFKSLDLLKQKLDQFPAGTVFKLNLVSARDDKTAPELVQQIKTYLEQHGMSLKSQP